MRKMFPVVLAAMLLSGVASAQQQQQQPAAPDGFAPEMFAARMLAEMEAGRKARSADLRRLGEAVETEKRRDGWASAEEERLKEAFAGRGERVAQGSQDAAPRIGAGSLARLDCRAARCAIEVTLPPDLPPKRHVAELQAVEAWLATSQPCAYTLVLPAPGSGGPVRAFTECEG